MSTTSESWRGDVHEGVAVWTRSSAPAPSVGPSAPTPVDDGAPTAVSNPRRHRANQGQRRDKPAKPAKSPVEVDPESQARSILLDQLTGRARSRGELATKLASRDIPDDVAASLLDRFEDVGLIDDEAFARMWIAGRQSAKGLARRALAQELRRKGVDDDVAREALDEVDPADEEQAARILVRKKLRTLSRVDDVTATRRLVAMLARKGYGAGLAYAVVRDELAEAGRDDVLPDTAD